MSTYWRLKVKSETENSYPGPKLHPFLLMLWIYLQICAFQSCKCSCLLGFSDLSAVAFRTQQVIWVSSSTRATKPTICVNSITPIAMAAAVTTTAWVTVSHVTTQVLNVSLTYITSCYCFTRWMDRQLQKKVDCVMLSIFSLKKHLLHNIYLG